VDTFYPVLEVDQVYFISKGTIKSHTGPKYSSIANEYEMTLGSSSIVVPCMEDTTEVPHKHFSFRSIGEIAQLSDGDMVDVIAVISNIGDVAEIISKRDNSQLQKRNITLVDDTGCAIDLTLWGETAVNWNTEGSQVLAIKNVKVSEFSGKSLSASFKSRFEINPDIPRAHELRIWAESQNISNLQSLTMAYQGSAPWKVLKVGKDEASGLGKATYFMTQATIMNIKHDDDAPLYYLACPLEGCNKKVAQDEKTNTFHCSKCHKDYENCNTRYILSLRIADSSSTEFVSVFDDIAQLLLGFDANTIKVMRERADPELQFIFSSAILGRYNFKIKAQEETYQDGLNVKLTVQSMERIDFAAESQTMIQKIVQLTT